MRQLRPLELPRESREADLCLIVKVPSLDSIRSPVRILCHESQSLFSASLEDTKCESGQCTSDWHTFHGQREPEDARREWPSFEPLFTFCLACDDRDSEKRNARSLFDQL